MICVHVPSTHPLADDIRAFLASRRAPPHVHRCPRCYGREACGLPCETEEDLRCDDGMPCSSFEVCSRCRKQERARIAGNAAILGAWADDGGLVPDPDPLADLTEPERQ